MPFLKNFQGAERRYIKDEYLARKDVLEYILWRVLNMDYYELSEPEACQALLLEYKEANDPVRQFWSEMEEQFVWDLLPYDFIHSLYLKWMDERHQRSRRFFDVLDRNFPQNRKLRPQRFYHFPICFRHPLRGRRHSHRSADYF